MAYAGAKESVDAVRKAFAEHGPFDGILGFSQGAAMTALLCGMRQQNLPENAWLDFRFAILVSGFKPRAKELSHNFEQPIEVPSLHIIGETDDKVAPAKSMDMLAGFASPVLYNHPGGHYIPSDATTRNALSEFVSKFATPPSSSL